MGDYKILRIVAYNGKTTVGDDEKDLEETLTNLRNKNFTVISHQAVWDDAELTLIETVLMEGVIFE